MSWLANLLRRQPPESRKTGLYLSERPPPTSPDMSHLIYQRLAESGDATTGLWLANSEYLSHLKVKGGFGFGVEDVYRAEKVDGETRIASGIYPLIKRTHGGFASDYKRRFGHPFVVEIAEVPNFEDVLIHIANWATNTRGCLSVGAGATYTFPNTRKNPMIVSSEIAYRWAFEHVFQPLLDNYERPLLHVRDEGYLLR